MGLSTSCGDVDRLRQRLIDRQTVTDQAIDRWQLKLRARVMARGGQFENLISSGVLILHCIVGPYIFILCTMFHSNVVDDNDDV